MFSKDNFSCERCGHRNDPLGYAPVPNELGERIRKTTCGDCWQEWLQKQTQLINHFGLDVSQTDTHEYLFDQMKLFFFNEGGNLEDIDTSKEGSISW